MFAQTQLKSFWFRFFQKSAEPTGDQRTHIARPKKSCALYISQTSIKKLLPSTASRVFNSLGLPPPSRGRQSYIMLKLCIYGVYPRLPPRGSCRGTRLKEYASIKNYNIFCFSTHIAHPKPSSIFLCTAIRYPFCLRFR